MCNIEKPKFNTTEEYFISRTLNGLASPNYDVHLEMILSLLSDMQANPKNPVTDKASKLIDSIIHKILNYKLSKEIDNMLSDPKYEEKARYAREVEESTRSLSLKATLPNISKLHYEILKELSANPGLSRKDLACRTGILMSSVTGRVKELIDGNLVRVTGRKVDPDTNRPVDTLEVI